MFVKLHKEALYKNKENKELIESAPNIQQNEIAAQSKTSTRSTTSRTVSALQQINQTQSSTTSVDSDDDKQRENRNENGETKLKEKV